MLLSTRITVIVVCTMISLVVLASFHMSSTPALAPQTTTPASPKFWNTSQPEENKKIDHHPTWTTEQLEPKFAYVQYATDLDYLCNTVINFERLRLFGVQEDRVLIIPKAWMSGDSRQAKTLQKVHEKYPDIVLHPIELLTTNKGDSTWKNSLTKLHAFGITNYTRVLIFDSDSLVLNNMDHYFLAPMATIAVPRAYWLTDSGDHVGHQILGSHVMLLEPSKGMYKRVVDEAIQSKEFDMEVINNMFSTSAMILPHRRLALLTGEFRAKDHTKYLAPDIEEDWNAMAEVSRAYLVHFSDWPLSKPWKQRSKAQWEAALPECSPDEKPQEDRPKCADRVMWMGFYESYNIDKENLCGGLF